MDRSKMTLSELIAYDVEHLSKNGVVARCERRIKSLESALHMVIKELDDLWEAQKTDDEQTIMKEWRAAWVIQEAAITAYMNGS